MPTTPKYGLTTPTLDDSPHAPHWLSSLADGVEAALAAEEAARQDGDAGTAAGLATLEQDVEEWRTAPLPPPYAAAVSDLVVDELGDAASPARAAVVAAAGVVVDGLELKVAAARKPLRVFASDFEETAPGSGVLRDWTPGHTGTAAHTVAASTRQDGGNTVTLVPAAASIALLKSRAIHGWADRPQWVTTDEMTVPTGRVLTLEIQNAASARLGTISVNPSGAGTVTLNANDGIGAQPVANVSTALGFVSTSPFRLGIWYDPRTGVARFYLFAGTGAGVRHVYMGQRTNTAGPYPIAYVQLSTGSAATGNATVARVEAYEVRGVIHGCSTDTPHNAFDMSPAQFPTQSRFNNSADALALRLWGQREGIVNMAHGGWTVEQMENGGLSATGEDTATWANMVTSLKPWLVVLGSGINSVSAAANKPTLAEGDTALASSKAAYRRLIQASLDAGVGLVCVRNCAPVGGHVSFDTSAKLDRVDDWNAWVNTLPSLYPPGRVVVSNVWSALVDPAVARTMRARYDVGDHIHFTVAGGEAVADADARAILSSLA